MKIRTITCHEVYNHGASLQEYALLKFLNSNGYNAKAINYKPPYLSNHFNLWGVSNPKYDRPGLKQLYQTLKLPIRIRQLRRKNAFDEFHKKYIPTDGTLYRNNDELKSNLPESDAFICGSDQIWNSYFENGRDPAFYLNFAPPSKRKISYAASFAIENLAEDVKPFVKSNVSKLNAVSVRETSGIDILEDLGISNAVQVLDPVFLLEKEYWKRFTTKIKEDYILVYDFDSNPVIKEIALDLKSKNNWKIYTLNQNIKYADRSYFLEGPERFISLVSQSKINLTNSFHSVAFSLIFEKDIRVFNRSEKINTRMRDLLQLFNLEKYLINSVQDFHKLGPINFIEVSKRLRDQIESSKKFLLDSLK